MASLRLESSSSSAAPAAAARGLVTVNAAFFREVKEVHAEVWAELERIRRWSEPAACTTAELHGLVRELDELRGLIELYFRLEEGYGYFDDPVYVDSRFSTRVSQLRSEHQTLLAEITRISDHAERLLYNGRLAEALGGILARFAGFCDQLAAHELREKELITEAFTTEVGCAD